MKNYKFYKKFDKWYIHLPDWEGDIADLEMVCGADIMLDIMSEMGVSIVLTISEASFAGSDVLIKKLEDSYGSTYTLAYYKGIELNMEVWLCNVTKFVFGYFPDKIYISK